MTHPDTETIRNVLGTAVTVFGTASKLYEVWQRRKGRREREAEDTDPDALPLDDHSDRIIARLERENRRLASRGDDQERRAEREYDRAEYYAGRVKALEAQMRKRSAGGIEENDP